MTYSIYSKHESKVVDIFKCYKRQVAYVDKRYLFVFHLQMLTTRWLKIYISKELSRFIHRLHITLVTMTSHPTPGTRPIKICRSREDIRRLYL